MINIQPSLRLSFRGTCRLLLLAVGILSACAQTCDICGDGKEVGAPDAAIQDPLTLEDSTCGSLDEQGLQGDFNPIQCTLVQLFVANSGQCDCQDVSPSEPTEAPVEPSEAPTEPPVTPSDTPTTTPTESPVAATESPTASPTESPVASTEPPTGPPTEPPIVATETPTESPTEAPATPTASPSSAAPTASTSTSPPTTTTTTTTPPSTPASTTTSPTTVTPPPTVTPMPTAPATLTAAPVPTAAPTEPGVPAAGNVTIILKNVSRIMQREEIVFYLHQTTVFLENSSALSNMYDIWCNLTNQTLGKNGTDGLAPLTTLVEVKGLQHSNQTRLRHQIRRLQDVNISSQIVTAINDDPQGYVALLQSSDTNSTKDYFATIENATASILPPATPKPPSQQSSLSTGAKVGIAFGVIIGVALLAFMIWNAECRKKPEPEIEASTLAQTSPPSTTPPAVAAAAGAGAGAGAAAAATTTRRPSATRRTSGTPSEMTPSLAMTGESIAGGDDSVSYAYSLDAGNVTAAGVSTAGGDASAITGGASVASSGTFSTTRKFKRTVVAPAGKLGIVIDTTLEGPVVHTVKPESPLKGKLFVGDVIVMIDDIDTKAMTATSITSLMVKTADRERVLTVLSNDPHR